VLIPVSVDILSWSLFHSAPLQTAKPQPSHFLSSLSCQTDKTQTWINYNSDLLQQCIHIGNMSVVLLDILCVASCSHTELEVNTQRPPGTHKAVQRGGVVQELLAEAGGADGLHALQADGPQEALLQQGRGQRHGLHAGQSQLHEHQPVHHRWTCRDGNTRVEVCLRHCIHVHGDPVGRRTRCYPFGYFKYWTHICRGNNLMYIKVLPGIDRGIFHRTMQI